MAIHGGWLLRGRIKGFNSAVYAIVSRGSYRTVALSPLLYEIYRSSRGASRVANIAQGEAECYICHETLTKS